MRLLLVVCSCISCCTWLARGLFLLAECDGHTVAFCRLTSWLACDSFFRCTLSWRCMLQGWRLEKEMEQYTMLSGMLASWWAVCARVACADSWQRVAGTAAAGERFATQSLRAAVCSSRVPQFWQQICAPTTPLLRLSGDEGFGGWRFSADVRILACLVCGASCCACIILLR